VSGGEKAAGWLLDGLHLPVDGGEGERGGALRKAQPASPIHSILDAELSPG